MRGKSKTDAKKRAPAKPKPKKQAPAKRRKRAPKSALPAPVDAGIFCEIKHPKKRAVLAALAETGSHTRAAAVAGVERSGVWYWRQVDPDFAAAYERAWVMSCAHLEDEARRRAVEGVEQTIWHKGEPVGTRREYSDSLLIFLTKAANPAKYRDQWKGEIVGAGGGPVRVDLSHLTDEQLDQLESLAAAVAGSSIAGGGEGA